MPREQGTETPDAVLTYADENGFTSMPREQGTETLGSLAPLPLIIAASHQCPANRGLKPSRAPAAPSICKASHQCPANRGLKPVGAEVSLPDDLSFTSMPREQGTLGLDITGPRPTGLH